MFVYMIYAGPPPRGLGLLVATALTPARFCSDDQTLHWLIRTFYEPSSILSLQSPKMPGLTEQVIGLSGRIGMLTTLKVLPAPHRRHTDATPTPHRR